jgi:patatin-like phospholipase/acyl hydrolase
MRILSLDGGGIRGVLTAKLLVRLDEACPGLLASVDLIAGTSTGGIQALYLAAGGTPQDLLDLYQDRAEDIFKKRDWWDALNPADELWRADFGHEDIYGVLTDVLGDTRMGDLQKDVLVPAFDMRRWGLKFYDRSKKNVLARDVARMTSAAPSYWPAFNWHLDGGLVANNPADCAVVEAVDLLQQSGRSVGECLLCISCLSVGTGKVPRKPPAPEHDWDGGLAEVLPVVLNATMEGSVGASAYRAQKLLQDRFFRINPSLAGEIDLSDLDAIPDLIRVADGADLDAAVSWMKEHWADG